MIENLIIFIAQVEEPIIGAIRARHYVAVLGSPEDLAIRLTQVLREAGWARIPLRRIVGNGVPWIWTVADAYFTGGAADARLLSSQRAPLWLRPSPVPNNPTGAKAWVDEKLGALLTDRIGTVLGALKHMRPWKKTLRAALTQMIGDVERNRTRLRYQEPWHQGLAVGSGAVEGSCKLVIQSRFKRAGMRWMPPSFFNVLALRLAQLNGAFQAF
jgi:hypothetical protein